MEIGEKESAMRSVREIDALAFVELLIQHPEKGLSDIMSEFDLSREGIAELTKSDVVRDALDAWIGRTMRHGWPRCPRCQGRAKELTAGLTVPFGVDFLIDLSPDRLRKELAGRVANEGCSVLVRGKWVCEDCGVAWSDTLDEELDRVKTGSQ